MTKLQGSVLAAPLESSLDYTAPHCYVVQGLALIQHSSAQQDKLGASDALQELAVAEVVFKFWRPAGVLAFNFIKSTPARYGGVSEDAARKMEKWKVASGECINRATLDLQRMDVINSLCHETLLKQIIAQNLGRSAGASPLSAFNAAHHLLSFDKGCAVSALGKIIEEDIAPHIAACTSYLRRL